MKDEVMIDHLNHPDALLLRSLLERSERAKSRLMIIDDVENIAQALKSGIRLHSLICTDRSFITEAIRSVMPADVEVKLISMRIAKKIFGGEKIARCCAIAYMPEPYLLADLGERDDDLIVLDHLAISGNIGAIMRTSAAWPLGALVLLGSEEVDIYDRRVIRASRGLVFSLSVVVAHESELIAFCKKEHVSLVMTSSHAATEMDSVMQTKSRLAFLFGREKEGCSPLLGEAADFHLKIPMSDCVESLNVSVAAAIVMFLRFRGR